LCGCNTWDNRAHRVFTDRELIATAMRANVRLLDPLGPLWRHRELLWQLTERDTVARYRGSAMGLVWAAVYPLLMLTVYTFFFTEVFRSKWSVAAQSKSQIALVLFVGLLLHSFFSESIVRAPSAVASHQNLVKKVVFPLEILPAVNLGTALFHLGIGFLIWAVFSLAIDGALPPTSILLPVVLAPLVLLTLGLSWILASLGIYLRDVNHAMPIVASVLMFASPVFYPLAALAEPFRSIVLLSPLTVPIEQARTVLIEGRGPDWPMLGVYSAVAVGVACAGCFWFQGTRKGFADVL
jgi:lipopolysaccharide transport system permease protein